MKFDYNKYKKICIAFMYIMIVILSFGSVIIHILYSEAPFVSMTKFTIHTNFVTGLVFLYNLVILSNEKIISKNLTTIKSALLIYLIIVYLGYDLLLTKGNPTYEGLRVYSNLMLHYIVPYLVFFNWVFFEEKIKYSFDVIVQWLGYPLIYFVISLFRGWIDGFYPYFFLNPTGTIPDGVGSYFNVIMSIICLCLIVVILSCTHIILNKMIHRANS